MIRAIKILLVLLALSQLNFAQPIIGYSSQTDFKMIQPGDPRINIGGTKYIQKIDSVIHMERFPDSLLALNSWQLKFNTARAKTLPGVILSFKTNSPSIMVSFRVVDGENRGSTFGILQDGEFTGFKAFSKTDGPALSFEIVPENLNEEILYEITMPIWANVEFVGLEIDSSYDLAEYSPNAKPVYVAYGNSITHGTGQTATYEIYPYQLSRKFNWELFNVAVGGGRISVPIAEMLRDDFEQIDYMTMLIGYNDFNYEGIDTVEYENRYKSFINTFREVHTDTKLFCITLTHTTKSVSDNSSITPEAFRRALRKVVQSFQNDGDENIYLIEGDAISSAKSLTDAVHFNVEGAASFADSLYQALHRIIKPTGIHDKKKVELNSGNEHTNLYAYPNPSIGFFSLRSGNQLKSVTVYNLLGQKIQTITNFTSRLNLNHLPGGVYFLLFTNLMREKSIQKVLIK